jgi:hypothetical protein
MTQEKTLYYRFAPYLLRLMVRRREEVVQEREDRPSTSTPPPQILDNPPPLSSSSPAVLPTAPALPSALMASDEPPAYDEEVKRAHSKKNSFLRNFDI